MRAAAARHFGGLPGPFWVVFSGTVVNRVGTMVLPFLVFYLGSRGVPADRTPYVLGALGAGGLAGPVVGGWLADRAGRRRAVLAGMIATPAAQGLLFWAPGVLTLSVAAALVGATSNLHAPGVAAVIADSAGPGRRQAAFGLYHWAINIGAATAGAVGGFLVEHGFLLLFAVDAVSCLGFAAVAAVALPRDAPGKGKGPGAGAVRADGGPGAVGHDADPAAGRGAKSGARKARSGGGYGVVLRDRLLLAFVAVSVAGDCVYAQTEFTVPLAIRDHGLPASVYGLVAVVNAVMVVVLQPFTNTYVLRFDRMRVWAFASVLIAAGVGLTGTAHSAAGFVLTVVVWSSGEVCAGGITTSVVADLAPPDARGRYQAALNWARGVARFLALGAGPALYAGVGPGALWWSVTGVGLTGAAAALLVRKPLAAHVSSAGHRLGADGEGDDDGDEADVRPGVRHFGDARPANGERTLVGCDGDRPMQPVASVRQPPEPGVHRQVAPDGCDGQVPRPRSAR